MMQFQWEQRGGRLKLVEDDAVRSVSEDRCGGSMGERKDHGDMDKTFQDPPRKKA